MRLFSWQRPTLKKSDIANFEKVVEFVDWFIKNEPIANGISFNSSNIIFNEGYRPPSGEFNNPDLFNMPYNTLREWFIIKFFYDINILKDFTKEEFKTFLDILDEAGCKTLGVAGEIVVKYDLEVEPFHYETEMVKIPTEKEKELFKVNFLADTVIGAELRILGWLYHKYFGEWYKIVEKRY